jgi:hypothetical protein
MRQVAMEATRRKTNRRDLAVQIGFPSHCVDSALLIGKIYESL